jgi:hypothetical protein
MPPADHAVANDSHCGLHASMADHTDGSTAVPTTTSVPDTPVVAASPVVAVCQGRRCQALLAGHRQDAMEVLRQATRHSRHGILVSTGCAGPCSHAPVVVVATGQGPSGRLHVRAEAVLGWSCSHKCAAGRRCRKQLPLLRAEEPPVRENRLGSMPTRSRSSRAVSAVDGPRPAARSPAAGTHALGLGHRPPPRPSAAVGRGPTDGAGPTADVPRTCAVDVRRLSALAAFGRRAGRSP